MSSGTAHSLWSEATDKTIQSSLRNWTSELEQKGKDAIQIRLPAKILGINKIIENFPEDLTLPHESSTAVPSSEQENPEAPGRKKRKVTNGKESLPASSSDQSTAAIVRNPGHAASNPKVNAHYAFLRHHWEELIDITNDIKIHINLLVPKIEDGDTFGVQVQEECLSEISRAQDSGYNLLEAQLKHLMFRGKLSSKLIKYPNVEDYQLALQEHDRKAVYLCRQHMVDLRNIYTLLTDLLHKNIVKITKPKGANSDGMY